MLVGVFTGSCGGVRDRFHQLKVGQLAPAIVQRLETITLDYEVPEGRALLGENPTLVLYHMHDTNTLLARSLFLIRLFYDLKL